MSIICGLPKRFHEVEIIDHNFKFFLLCFVIVVLFKFAKQRQYIFKEFKANWLAAKWDIPVKKKPTVDTSEKQKSGEKTNTPYKVTKISPQKNKYTWDLIVRGTIVQFSRQKHHYHFPMQSSEPYPKPWGGQKSQKRERERRRKGFLLFQTTRSWLSMLSRAGQRYHPHWAQPLMNDTGSSNMWRKIS